MLLNLVCRDFLPDTKYIKAELRILVALEQLIEQHVLLIYQEEVIDSLEEISHV